MKIRKICAHFLCSGSGRATFGLALASLLVPQFVSAQTYDDFYRLGTGIAGNYSESGLANTNNRGPANGPACTNPATCLFPLDIAVNESGQIIVWRKVKPSYIYPFETTDGGPHDNPDDINGNFEGQVYWLQVNGDRSVPSSMPSADVFNVIQFSESVAAGASGPSTPSSRSIIAGGSFVPFDSATFTAGTPTAGGWRGSGTRTNPWYIGIDVATDLLSATVYFKYTNGDPFIVVEVIPKALIRDVTTGRGPVQFGHYIDTYLTKDTGWSTCVGAAFCGTTIAQPPAPSTSSLPTFGVIMGFQKGGGIGESTARVWDRYRLAQYGALAGTLQQSRRLNNFVETTKVDTGIAAQWNLVDATGNPVTTAGQVATPFSYRVTFTSAAPPAIKLQKTTTDLVGGPFNFTISNTASNAASVSTTAVNTPVEVDGDTSVAGTQPFYIATPGQDVTIAESAFPQTFIPDATNTLCTEAAAPTVKVGSFDAATNTYTIPAAQTVSGKALTCTFVNRKRNIDLTISKTNGAAVNSVASGSDVTYTIVATNNGPDPVNGALLRDTPIAAGLTCPSPSVGGTPPAATCTNSAGGTGCPAATIPYSTLTGASGVTLGTLGSGQSVTITLVCRVN